jgi:glycosyltransferase involved in cell wall biosynthesis
MIPELRGPSAITPDAIQLSVVMPVYNEEACVEGVIGEIRRWILDRVPASELIVVDDGSTDAGPAILDVLATAHSAIRVLHKSNGGHGDALLHGLRHATGEYLFLLDSDGQIPLEDFQALWERRAPNAFVCGVRKQRRDPLHRRILTRTIVGAIFLLFGRRVRDSNTPFKVVPRSFWHRVQRHVPPGTLAPSLFLSVLAARDPAMKFIEVPVVHQPRRSGKTVLRPWRLLAFCAKAFRQLLALRRSAQGL